MDARPQRRVGSAGTVAVPGLKNTTDSRVFGESFVPGGESVAVTLENVGDEALVISD